MMKHSSKKHIFDENKEEIFKLKQQGVSQVEIGKTFGVSEATVSSWLSGKKREQRKINKTYVMSREYTPPKHWELVNSVLNRSTGIVHPA